MELKRHYMIAIIMVLILLLIVLATPSEGQPADVLNAGNTDGMLATACMENWTYSEWSPCSGGVQTRATVSDLNECGTRDNVSGLTRACDDAACIEDWVCSEWSGCMDRLQTRACRDVNSCGTEEKKPMLRRTCISYCLEAWICEPWSACRNGVQTRVCSDINTCQDRVVNTTETQECEPGGEGPGAEEKPGPGPAEPSAARVFDEIKPDAPARLIVDRPEVGVSQLSISVRNRVRNARVEVRRLMSRPAEVEQAIRNNTGQVYSYIEIEKENMNDTDVSEATVDFEVNRSWIREQSINASTIRLMRYVNGTWTSLSTTLVNEDAEKLYFQADTPGFSIFAIAGEYIIDTAGIICIPMDRRCYGDEVQEGDLDGLAWTIIEECEFGCRSGGTCNNEPPDQGTAQPEDYVFYLLLAILVIIAVLAVVMTLLKIKRGKAAKELEGYTAPSK